MGVSVWIVSAENGSHGGGGAHTATDTEDHGARQRSTTRAPVARYEAGSVMNDAARLSLDEALADVKNVLWLARQHAAPAGVSLRGYLPFLQDSLRSLTQAVEVAKLEVPQRILVRAELYQRKHGPDVSELIAEFPVLACYWSLVRGRELVSHLIDDLLNEGRPTGDLRLRKLRRHD